MFSYKIDWITATKKMGRAGDTVEGNDTARGYAAMAVADMGIGKRWELRSNSDVQKFYRWSFDLKPFGWRISVPINPAEQGVKVEASGSTLRAFKDGYVMHAALQNGGFGFTRVDYALDFRGEYEDMRTLIALNEDILKDEKRSAKLINTQGAFTMYAGSRQSNAYMRVYDKGMEQKSEDKWVRMELEAKGELAANLSVQPMMGFSSAVYAMLTRFDLGGTRMLETIQEVFQDGVKVNSTPPRVKGATERWLWSQVASAVVKLCKSDPDAAVDFVTGLNLMIAKHIDPNELEPYTDS